MARATGEKLGFSCRDKELLEVARKHGFKLIPIISSRSAEPSSVRLKGGGSSAQAAGLPRQCDRDALERVTTPR
jgi:hypothetical protein